MEAVDEGVLELLGRIVPFRLLTLAERQALLPDLSREEFDAGDTVIRQGNEEDDRVFILQEGSVEVVDPRRGATERLDVITAGHYFGERKALFDHPRSMELRAIEPSVCYALSGDRFLRLVSVSRPFAQALGDLLREKQGIFVAVDRFLAELLHAAGRGVISVQELLGFYADLQPALHGGAQDSAIDFNALTYAVHRLPGNLTRIFAYFVTDDLPLLYSVPDRTFAAVSTRARRRSVYEMAPGKNMVLLRDGITDLVDFVTCLCVQAVEAHKLRRRLDHPRHLEQLGKLARNEEQEQLAVLHSLPLSEEEVEGLVGVWGERAGRTLYEIALHHEDFYIQIKKQLNNYNSRNSEEWTQQVERLTRELMGCYPRELPAEIAVHIISSNTHSVTNCLSPYWGEVQQEVLSWGERTGHPLVAESWHHRRDLVYALARDYFRDQPERAAEKRACDERQGMVHLSETAFTGIELDLIDAARLDDDHTDPEVPPLENKTLLVNIDYAFGQQAEEIIANLMMLFGPNLKSVNILGKAGALQGNRGDVLVPTAFVEQTKDLFLNLPPLALDINRLNDRCPGRAVHAGPLLTVTGTLLQNRTMLNFYRHIWRCIGLEMEGWYYAHKILESIQLGVVAPGLTLRCLYYVSDLPLAHDATLSRSLRAVEGLPPLYAVTREILSGIAEQKG